MGLEMVSFRLTYGCVCLTEFVHLYFHPSSGFYTAYVTNLAISSFHAINPHRKPTLDPSPFPHHSPTITLQLALPTTLGSITLVSEGVFSRLHAPASPEADGPYER